MEVQGKSFVIDATAIPDTTVELGVSDPAKQPDYYREAGLDAIVQNLRPIQLADTASRAYQEIPASDYQLYSAYMPTRVSLAECTVPPPDAAVSILVTARRAQLFDDIEIHSNPDNGESLLVGSIRIGQDTRRYALYQWATDKLTSIEELRKQKKLSRAVGQMLKSILEWRPNIDLNLKPRTKGQPSKWLRVVWFSLVTLAASAGCWYMFYWSDSWWITLAVSLGAALGMMFYGDVIKDEDISNAVWKPVSTIMVLHAIALAVAGPWHLVVWNNTPRTEEALVCSIYSRQVSDHTDWRVVTSKGHMTVEAGFYDGVYYDSSTQKAAKSLVGNWVKLTVHGRLGGDTPYVTAATTLREGSGNCGK